MSSRRSKRLSARAPSLEALLEREQNWFRVTLGEVLTKLKSALAVVGDVALNDEALFNEILACEAVEPILERLGGAYGRGMFRAMFSEVEWEAFERSAGAIVAQDETLLLTEQLRRQRDLLQQYQPFFVNVSVLNHPEQEALSRETASTFGAIMGEIGVAEESGRLKQPVQVIEAEMALVEVEDEEPQQQVQRETQKSRKRSESVAVEKPAQKSTKRAQKEAPSQMVVIQEVEEVAVIDEEANELQQRLLDAVKDLEHVTKLLGMTEDWQTRTLHFLKIPPPDPSLATADEGNRLLKDPALFANSLCAPRVSCEDLPANDNDDIEKLGTLLRWWGIVRKSFAFVAIMASLRQRKERLRSAKKDLKALYKLSAKELGLSYEQAIKYEKLGKFLIRFPCFMLQTIFTSLQEWNGLLESGDQPETRLLELMGDEVRQSFSAPLALTAAATFVEDEEQVEAEHVCCVCHRSSSDRDALLFSCTDCRSRFHEVCAGYVENSLSQDISLERPLRERGGEEVLRSFMPDIYCNRCLARHDLEPSVVCAAISEQEAVAEFLNNRANNSTLDIIPGDGYCIFKILEDFARERLGWSATANVFCQKLAEAALAAVEDIRALVGSDSIEEDAVLALRELLSERSRVGALRRGLWRRIEVQHLFLGYVKMFENRVFVSVYQVADKKVRRSTQYPENGVAGARELRVLHWGTVDHYDELVAL